MGRRVLAIRSWNDCRVFHTFPWNYSCSVKWNESCHLATNPSSFQPLVLNASDFAACLHSFQIATESTSTKKPYWKAGEAIADKRPAPNQCELGLGMRVPQVGDNLNTWRIFILLMQNCSLFFLSLMFLHVYNNHIENPRYCCHSQAWSLARLPTI